MEISDPTRFLAVARERRKIMMRSRCEIRRPQAEREWDPVTGTYSDPGTTLVYEGPCQLKPRSALSPAQLRDLGGAEHADGGYVVQLPHEVPLIDMSDTVTVTASDDQWIVGRALPVSWVEVGAESKTCRTIVVAVQDRPGVNDA